MSDNYIGIDYGLGMANCDRETGIRYGVISQGSFWSNDAEPIYPDPEGDYEAECGQCGYEWTEYAKEGEQLQCPECDHEHTASFDDWMYEGVPVGWDFGESEETLECSDMTFGVFVTRSPYYTRCMYCSPCAPGAGDLDSWKPNGVKTYCLGPDWFPGSDYPIPYPIWRVDDDTLVAGGEHLEAYDG